MRPEIKAKRKIEACRASIDVLIEFIRTHPLSVDGSSLIPLANPKEMAQEDVQTLRAAAGRLDQLLNEIEEARCKEAREKDMKILQAATSCIDHLLSGMTGNEVMPELKLRPNRDTTE